MNKRLPALLMAALVGASCLMGCSAHSESSSSSTLTVSTDSELDTSSYELADEDEALDYICENCGTFDAESGKDYQFEYLDCLEIEGMPFYIFDCSIEGDEGEAVLLDTLFAAADGSGIYSGEYNLEEGTASYYDGTNYLEAGDAAFEGETTE